MRVLILRAWTGFTHSATFSTLRTTGVGGTEYQLLAHAGTLRSMGHDVTVLGVSREDVVEEGVLFKGSSGKDHALTLLRTEYRNTDVVFLNVVDDVARVKSLLPKAIVIEVCQNGPHFKNDAFIDVYALVGFGQLAYYSTSLKQYRHKFMLLLSVPPWAQVYAALPPVEELDQVVWVGSMQKQGFRRWAKAMVSVMSRHATLRWVLCIPAYDPFWHGRVPLELRGLDLPFERIELRNLPLPELAREIQRSKILLASLGGEDGPVSYLDGHAAGVPVLCGDDIYGKYYNPEGTGLRCSTTADCIAAIEFLLAHPDARARMGRMGKGWVEKTFTEEHQRQCLQNILEYAALSTVQGFPAKSSSQSDKKFPLRYWLERLEIKLAGYSSGGPQRPQTGS